MKKVLYFVPFILYVMFYVFIIIADGTIESLAIIDVLILLVLLLISGLGTMSDKKLVNVIGTVTLFILSFALIKMGIENDYWPLAETKIAIAMLLYYLILFIATKNKRLLKLNTIIISILVIIFVPIKIQYRDGGTEEYRALSYKYIKWNTEENDLYWFPKNFHSLEYYKPVESPIVNVSVGNQKIECNKGSFNWSKTVDGINIFAIGDATKSAVNWIYKDTLVIDDDNIVKIDTSFNIGNVKYTEYKEEYENMEINTVSPLFKELNFDADNKTIDLINFENGEYIIIFSIYEDEQYADYAFKIVIKRYNK